MLRHWRTLHVLLPSTWACVHVWQGCNVWQVRPSHGGKRPNAGGLPGFEAPLRASAKAASGMPMSLHGKALGH